MVGAHGVSILNVDESYLNESRDPGYRLQSGIISLFEKRIMTVEETAIAYFASTDTIDRDGSFNVSKLKI